MHMPRISIEVHWPEDDHPTDVPMPDSYGPFATKAAEPPAGFDPEKLKKWAEFIIWFIKQFSK